MKFRDFIAQAEVVSFLPFNESETLVIPEGNPLLDMVTENDEEIDMSVLIEHVKYLQEEFDVTFTGKLLEKGSKVAYETTIKRVLHQLVDVGGKYMLVLNGIETDTYFTDLEKAKKELETGAKFNKDAKTQHLGAKLKKLKKRQ